MTEAPQINVAKIAESYDSDIIVRRWAATWIDVVFLFVIAAGLNTLIGDSWRYTELTMVLVLFLSYYLLVEGLTGRTVGKTLAKIRVVDAEGGLPSFKKALIRTAIRIFEVNPLLAGGLPAGVVAGLSKRKQRLGDIAANTFVIKSADLNPKKPAEIGGEETPLPGPDFACPSCDAGLSIAAVIDSCIRSWPSTGMTSFGCPECKRDSLLSFPKNPDDSGSRVIPQINGLAFELQTDGISVSLGDRHWVIPKNLE